MSRLDRASPLQNLLSVTIKTGCLVWRPLVQCKASYLMCVTAVTRRSVLLNSRQGRSEIGKKKAFTAVLCFSFNEKMLSSSGKTAVSAASTLLLAIIYKLGAASCFVSQHDPGPELLPLSPWLSENDSDFSFSRRILQERRLLKSQPPTCLARLIFPFVCAKEEKI